MIHIKKHVCPIGRHEMITSQSLEFELGSEIQDAFRVAKLLAEINHKRVIFTFNRFQVDTDAYPDVDSLMADYSKPKKEKNEP